MSESGRAAYEQFAYALAQFAFGVALLGHGVAATAFLAGMTPVTVALPLVGATVAYRSFVGLLPHESSLSADGLVALLAVATTGVVNLVAPPLYRAVNVLPVAPGRPDYWPTLVAAVGGFVALSVYELLASRTPGGYALAKLLGGALAATGVGVLLLVVPARPVAPFSATDALAGIGGALLASVAFDYGRLDQTTWG